MKKLVASLVTVILFTGCQNNVDGVEAPKASADSSSLKTISYWNSDIGAAITVIEFEGFRYTVFEGGQRCCLLRTEELPIKFEK